MLVDEYKTDGEWDLRDHVDYYAESVSSNESPSVLEMFFAESGRRESLIIDERPNLHVRAVSDNSGSGCTDKQTRSVFDKSALSRLQIYEPQHERSTSDTAFQFRQTRSPTVWRTISGTPIVRSKAGISLGIGSYADDEASSLLHTHADDEVSSLMHNRDLSLSLSTYTVYTEHRLDCWSPLATKSVPCEKHEDERRRSRRGSEMEPCYQIQVVNGPRPGLYALSARVDGRPSWVSDSSSLQWSIGVRSWLLRDIASRKFMCLATLKVDVINPCISKQLWRVVSHSRHALYDNYAFRADTQMYCVGVGPSGIFQAKKANFQENMLVKVKRGLGIARFIGPLEDQEGTFLGVELFAPTGLHNGTRKGLFYFEAKRKHAVFVRYPEGVIDFFGHISDRAAILVEELLAMVATVPRITKRAKERSIKVLAKITESNNLFCASRKRILKLILFYELVMFK